MDDLEKSRFTQKLKETLNPDQILEQEPMSAHTTFHVGGPAAWFVIPKSHQDIENILALARQHSVPLYVLGRGSNVLVSDEGLEGLVMHIGSSLSKLHIEQSDTSHNTLHVEAGARNSAVAHAACKAELTGLEFASGIPGSIGGSAIMNAGAYGGDFSQVVESIRCIMHDGQIETLSSQQAQWGYRSSKMFKENLIVLSVVFSLKKDDPDSIKQRMVDLAQRRAAKQPLDIPSAGSTFKRPEGFYAGKLIQDAGMQGCSVGDAQVSLKHAGFIVNNGNARASDILKLTDEVRGAVLQQFGVELELEVRTWGFGMGF